MNFKSADITAIEVEIQILIENSIEKKSLSEALKMLNPQIKQYKKAREVLDKAQQKEWKNLSKEIENQKEELFTNTKKIIRFQEMQKLISKTITEQADKHAEKQPAQPLRPRRPGK